MTKKQESKPSIHSADDLIVKVEAEKLGKVIPEAPAIEKQPQAEDKLSEPEKPTEDLSEDRAGDKEHNEEEKSQEEDNTSEEEKDLSASDESSDDELDEYGTKVGKPKLYTEEEVQSMIRKRLKDRHESKDVQDATKEFTPDPNSEESWETQLDAFIDRRLESREKEARDKEWKREEEITQADYEIRFTEGMGKYKDFKQVVANKPLTNAMMLATRSMKDPAAFVYAASKQHPKELERISQIKDVVHQATEIGRLEERMKKARIIPQSPPPSKKIKGDASSEMPQVSIDQRIAQHAKDRVMSRR